MALRLSIAAVRTGDDAGRLRAFLKGVFFFGKGPILFSGLPEASWSASVQIFTPRIAHTECIVFLRTVSIRLPGDLDVSNAGALTELLRCAESADQAVLDFSDVQAISPELLRALIGLVNQMIAHNRLGVVRILGASPSIVKIFELCNAETLFDFADCHGAPSARRMFMN